MAEPSCATSKKVSTKPDGQPPKKRGVKGNFTGQRLKVLEDHLKPYQEVSKKGPPSVHKWFTLTFFPYYWTTFHWSLPIEVDSIVGPLLPQRDEDLTAEQRVLKKSLMDAGTQKIKSWFNYRRNALGLNSGKDPWSPLLEQIKGLGNPPPRKPSESQFYMQHPDFKEKVDEVFDVKWKAASLPENHRMAYRCEVAQALLDGEGDEVKARLRGELEASHERDLEAYHKGLWVEETTDPEKRAEAIASISPVLQPLLEGIHALTGLYCGFFAAAAPPNAGVEDIQCICLTAGKSTSGQELSEVDQKGFSQATRLFVRSVAIASGHSDPRQTSNASAALISTPHIPRISTDIGRATTPFTPLRIPSTPLPLAPTTTPTPAAAPSAPQTSFRRDAIDSVRASLQGLEPDVGEALIESVAKLPPAQKKSRIAELKSMGKLELERANNIANNRVLMASLGIKDASSMFKAPPRPSSVESSGDEADYVPSTSKTATLPKSSKSANAKGSGRMTRGMAKSSLPLVDASQKTPETSIAGDDMDVEMGDGMEEDNPVGGNDIDNNDIDLAARSDLGEDQNDAVEADDAAELDIDGGSHAPDDKETNNNAADAAKTIVQPQWFFKAMTTLTSVSEDDYGPNWMKMLDHWGKLEGAAKYEPNGLLLTAKDRPYEVLYWIKSKRPYERLPTIPDHAAFGEKWWKWWVNINPSWRHAKAKNGTSLKRGRLGEWGESLPVTGLNGLLSVIVALWFWREATPSTANALSKWHAAVADVEWTLLQLISANVHTGNVPDKRQSKRTRRGNKD